VIFVKLFDAEKFHEMSGIPFRCPMSTRLLIPGTGMRYPSFIPAARDLS
jgi:hypothetical protein